MKFYNLQFKPIEKHRMVPIPDAVPRARTLLLLQIKDVIKSSPGPLKEKISLPDFQCV